MDDYEYEGVFKSLYYRSALVEVDGEMYNFSLKYCRFTPDPLDLRAEDPIIVYCPSWLAEKMHIEE